MDMNSLAHTKWNCKYHVVFDPKFRRIIIYNQLREDIGKIIQMLCERKDIKIIEAELCPDHIHMMISVPPKLFYFLSTKWVNLLFATQFIC